jgi:hypothetical protein
MLNSRPQSTASYSWYPDPSQVPVLNPHSWASLSRLKSLPKVWRVMTNWGAAVDEADAAKKEEEARVRLSSLDGYTLAGGVQLEDSMYEDIHEIEASPDVSPGKHSSLTMVQTRHSKPPSFHLRRVCTMQSGRGLPTKKAMLSRRWTPSRAETSAQAGCCLPSLLCWWGRRSRPSSR